MEVVGRNCNGSDCGSNEWYLSECVCVCVCVLSVCFCTVFVYAQSWSSNKRQPFIIPLQGACIVLKS